MLNYTAVLSIRNTFLCVRTCAGPTTGGTEVVIFGTNLIRSSLLVCKFNETVVNATEFQSQPHVMRCVTPADTIGSAGGDVAVAVSNNGVEFFASPVNVRLFFLWLFSLVLVSA